MRLSYSRMPIVRAYFRETQEMVFDAHDKAFAFYGGVCRRGIYDNMKTAVETVFVGRAREYNRRFLQLCSHHLVEPVACTPASGWEKGQVENQVGTIRDLLFRPKPKVKTLDELNAWLVDQCVAYARRTKHPDNLRSVRGGEGEPDAVPRAVRGLRRKADAGDDDLPDHP
jgi:transposase